MGRDALTGMWEAQLPPEGWGGFGEIERPEARPDPEDRVSPSLRPSLHSPALASPSSILILCLQEHWLMLDSMIEDVCVITESSWNGDTEGSHRVVSTHVSHNSRLQFPAGSPVSQRSPWCFCSSCLALSSSPLDGAGWGRCRACRRHWDGNSTPGLRLRRPFCCLALYTCHRPCWFCHLVPVLLASTQVPRLTLCWVRPGLGHGSQSQLLFRNLGGNLWAFPFWENISV